MEEIIALKKQTSQNSPSKLKEMLTHISNTGCDDIKLKHKLEENEIRITKLSKEVFALKEEYHTEKQNLESKIYELENCNCILHNLNESQQNANLTFRDLEKRYLAMKNRKPSLNDQQLLNRGKRKHELYKQFTGIRWDYSALETIIQGCITNKKDYLKKISYKNNMDRKILKELLWEEIHQSTINPDVRKDKENKPVNN